MKRLLCWIKAIPLWIRTGHFAPHLYECEYENRIVIATERSFRLSDSLEHKPGEIVYRNAIVQKCRCIYCGHEDVGWYENAEEKQRLEGYM